MDLSFTRFDAEAEPIAMPHDLALLMVGIAARQAASATAAAQAALARGEPDAKPFAPPDGSFNGATAEAIQRWQESEDAVYRAVSADLQGGGDTAAASGNREGRVQAPREV